MDETTVESATEEIVAQEGSINAELAKEEAKKESETVPLSVHLELKKDLKELKRQVKEAATPKEEKAATNEPFCYKNFYLKMKTAGLSL